MIADLSVTEDASRGRPEATAPPGFEELLLAHQHRLFLHIKSQVANHHEAEDLLQRTNVVLWRKRAAFEAGSSFGAWSAAIARLEILNQRRQQRRTRWLFSDQEEGVETLASPPPEEIANPDALRALKDCLGRLPSRDQELVLTRYGSDRTLGEYARLLNRSPGTLKARLFKIREALRKGIERELRKAGAPISGASAPALAP